MTVRKEYLLCFTHLIFNNLWFREPQTVPGLQFLTATGRSIFAEFV